nr:zonadhesin-like protein 13 [Limnephilus flavicornis]
MQFLLRTLCLGFFLHRTTAEYIVPIVPIDDGGETTTPSPIPPKCTGPHEFWTECGNDSCVRDCSSFGRSDIACRPSCNPGCICEWTYYRNADGVCVKPEDCGIDVCPEPNKVLTSCLSPCGEDCLTLGQNITCNFLVCNPGCDCKPGFFRNSRAECVSPDQCECGVNEQVDLCPNPSVPETCESIGKNVDYPPSTKGICRPACRCKQNYKRNINQECVYIAECPQPFPCKDTEEYNACPDRCLSDSCCTNDGFSCALGGSPLLPCRPRCDCKPKYCRNKQQQCVDKQINEICGGDPNAAFDPCGDPCPVTCLNKATQATCDKPCKYGGCKCKSGYVRNLDNKCIKAEKCLPCNGDVNANPSDGCNCKTGYIKDKTGKCAAVPPPKCGQNEVVDKCALCDDLTCAKVFAGEPAGCTKPAVCPVACRCKAGYVRNDKKQCVKTENCCSDPNSELVSSPSPCAGGTCECPAFANCKTKPPAKGCRCKAGFLKKSAADVTCVPIKSCPKKAANSPVKY